MTSFKKGQTFKVNVCGDIETVTVSSDFEIKTSNISFIVLKRKVGAAYTITTSRFLKSII